MLPWSRGGSAHVRRVTAQRFMMIGRQRPISRSILNCVVGPSTSSIKEAQGKSLQSQQPQSVCRVSAEGGAGRVWTAHVNPPLHRASLSPPCPTDGHVPSLPGRGQCRARCGVTQQAHARDPSEHVGPRVRLPPPHRAAHRSLRGPRKRQPALAAQAWEAGSLA
jgi:hypothetical protein